MKKVILFSLAAMLFVGVASAQATQKKETKAPVTKTKTTTKAVTKSAGSSDAAKVAPAKTASVAPANKPATTIKRKHHPAKKAKNKK